MLGIMLDIMLVLVILLILVLLLMMVLGSVTNTGSIINTDTDAGGITNSNIGAGGTGNDGSGDGGVANGVGLMLVWCCWPILRWRQHQHADVGAVCCRLIDYWGFTFWQHLKSYQDGYRFAAVNTHGNFIMLPHWETRPPAP